MKLQTVFRGNRKLFLCIAVLCAMFLPFLVSCGKTSPEQLVAKELDLSITNAEVITGSDTHNGFHADGTTYIVLRFSDDSVLKQIEASFEWRPLPMDDTAAALAYGTSDGTKTVGAYLTDSNGRPFLPQIKKGYYLLADKQAGSEEDMINRHSFNFILAVYDTEEECLHFCQLDT